MVNHIAPFIGEVNDGMSSWSGRSTTILSTLAAISERVAEEHDLPGLYGKAVQVALAELGADRASLLLWDGVSEHLTLAALAGAPLADRESFLAIEGSPAGWVVRRCEALLVDADSVGVPLSHDLLRHDSIRQGVYVPIVGQGRVLGVLAAARFASLPFALAERDLLGLLASQVALTIERVRLRMAIIGDSSERQQSAQRLAQTEKLAGMGRLAASIAHEINNPLQAVQNSLHLLANRSLPDEKRTRYFGMAQEQVERLVSLVQRMLNFYQPAREGMRATAIHPLLEHVLRNSAEQMERNAIILERDWTEGLPRVMGIASHLKQVFQNLTMNAIEAMPRGGQLVVRTRADNAVGSVLIEFSDNGAGIAPGALQTIFEPFYTTKSDGSGLGLSISYSIIEQHGGMLSVQSSGARTTFRITLPALIGSSRPADGAPAPSLAAGENIEQEQHDR
jgi:signal transduction histidine kinase